MYNKDISIKAFIAFIVLASALASACCNNEPLEEQTPGYIELTIDWTEALPSGSLPQTVRYCLYPSGNGAMTQMESGNKEFKLVLPEDNYKVLIFNSDADNIEFYHLDKFDKAEARIPTSKSKAGEGTTKAAAIPLYGLVVSSLNIKNGENKRASLTPTPLVGSVSLNIDVNGMEYVASCKASLSGVPSSLNLSRQEVTPNNPTTLTFDTEKSEKGVSAKVMILGVPGKKGETPEEPIKNVLTLDMTLTDGTTVSASADLGDKLADVESPEIALDVEASITKSPEFTVVINHWEIAPGDSMTIE